MSTHMSENGKKPSEILREAINEEAAQLTEQHGRTVKYWYSKIRSKVGRLSEIVGRRKGEHAVVPIRQAVGRAVGEIMAAENRGDKPGATYEHNLSSGPSRSPDTRSFEQPIPSDGLTLRQRYGQGNTDGG